MSYCGGCGGAIVTSARFCTECGWVVPKEPAGFGSVASVVRDVTPPSPDAMRLCPTCGVIAPTALHACTLCGSSFDKLHYAPSRSDGVLFAAVLESDVVCRSCGFRAVVDSFHTTSELECHRCGIVQPFDTSQWSDALAHAHAVADLSGPPAAGQGARAHGETRGGGPFAPLGVTATTAEFTESGFVMNAGGTHQTTLRVKVATGYPLCPNGHGPLLVTLEPRGTRTHCALCNEGATYGLPPNADAMAEGLVGVIDEERRTDRGHAKIAENRGGGAVALTCPNCSAALPVTEGATVVSCAYCATASMIPRQLARRATLDAKRHAFWLLFRGPSRMRRERAETNETNETKPEAKREQAEESTPPTEQRGGDPEPRGREARKATERARRLNAVTSAMISSGIFAVAAVGFVVSQRFPGQNLVAAVASAQVASVLASLPKPVATARSSPPVASSSVASTKPPVAPDWSREACTGVTRCYQSHAAWGDASGTLTVTIGKDGKAMKATYKGGAPAGVKSCLEDSGRAKVLGGYTGPGGQLACTYRGTLLEGVTQMMNSPSFHEWVPSK